MRQPNTHKVLEDGSVEIKLKSGTALVDKGDLENILKYRWVLSGNGYAMNSKYIHPDYHFTYLHHLILSPKKGMVVDHINHNTLDNRRLNLRYLAHKDNLLNSHKKLTCGVSKVKNWGKKIWRARVGSHPVRYEGHFYTEQEARDARNRFLESCGIDAGAKGMRVL